MKYADKLAAKIEDWHLRMDSTLSNSNLTGTNTDLSEDNSKPKTYSVLLHSELARMTEIEVTQKFLEIFNQETEN